MIRPVFVYGSPVLRKVAAEIAPDYPNLKELISDMFDTMYHSEGIGLAAPQIGISIRLFVIDASPLQEDYPNLKDFKKVFINPTIVLRSGDLTLYNEGCLSLPQLREDVQRENVIVIDYLDEDFNPQHEQFEGIAARIIQHEYDHLEGIVFTDRVSTLRRQLLRGKLNSIARGRFSASYNCKVG